MQMKDMAAYQIYEDDRKKDIDWSNHQDNHYVG